MKCIKCGYDMDKSFEFCPKCGERITESCENTSRDIKSERAVEHTESIIAKDKNKLIGSIVSISAVIIAVILGVSVFIAGSISDKSNLSEEEAIVLREEKLRKKADIYGLNERFSEGGIYEFEINYTEWSEGGSVFSRYADLGRGSLKFGVDTQSENAFVVRGKCKNIASKSACSDIGHLDIRVSVVFDDKYVTDGYAKLETSDGQGFYNDYVFNPKVELPITFYFPSSLEMEETYESAVMYIYTIDSEEYIGKFNTTGGKRDIEGVCMGVKLK